MRWTSNDEAVQRGAVALLPVLPYPESTEQPAGRYTVRRVPDDSLTSGSE